MSVVSSNGSLRRPSGVAARAIIAPFITFISLMMIACSICAPSSVALGLSPASITIAYNDTVAGTIVPFTITPLATGGETGFVRLRAEGDLAEHVSFSSAISSPGVPVPSSVYLPEGLTPGDHPQDIVVTLIPEGAAGTVSANIEVATTLLVQVPYPDQYLTGTLTPNIADGTSILISLMLQNRGNVPTTPVYATLEVLDGDVKRDELPLDIPVVLPTSFAGVSASYDGVATRVILPGVYTLRAIVPYADTELIVERETAIGAPVFNITHARYAAEESGAIRPVDVRGHVLWNRQLNYSIFVYVDNGTVPATTVSLSDVNFATRLYIDTDVVGEPQERVRVIIVFADGTPQSSVDILVRHDAVSPRKLPLILLAVAVLLLAGIVLTFQLLKVRSCD
ncbi:TPA: hypothetical protein HA251_07265 [Candidatus Woesearchaeota archaeon]|nr:hypothetical protein [Candidatus Woesearchaeota archaeon]